MNQTSKLVAEMDRASTDSQSSETATDESNTKFNETLSTEAIVEDFSKAVDENLNETATGNSSFKMKVEPLPKTTNNKLSSKDSDDPLAETVKDRNVQQAETTNEYLSSMIGNGWNNHEAPHISTGKKVENKKKFMLQFIHNFIFQTAQLQDNPSFSKILLILNQR